VGGATLALVVSVSGLACGDTASSPTDASTDAIVASNDVSIEPSIDAGIEPDDSTNDASDAALLATCPACPTSPPEAGASCLYASPELDCEYGDDPRLINVLARCLSGQWVYPTPGTPLADSGIAIGDAGCPATYAEAQSAASCDTPSCSYPEGTCTCYVGSGPSAGNYWSCLAPALPPGCPSTVAAAQSSTICSSNALRCYYPGGTCICFVSDAGSPWQCTVPEAGCPATRPRLGSACDPTLAKECKYIPIGCSSPTGHLLCVPSPCGGNLWSSFPGALCQ
jgi:hypothetical protein